MEVTRTASTSRESSARSSTSNPSSGSNSAVRAQSSKRHKSDIVAPSSPSKPKSHQSRLVDTDKEARRQASLLSFAEARARESSTYSPVDRSDADFEYPPGYAGGGSARGLLEQIKNRMDQHAPKPSNFLQKAKQVQQSLLEKQQRAAEVQRLREESARRESFRSAGFADEHAAPSQHGYGRSSGQSPSLFKSKSVSSQSAFSRARQRATESDADSDDDDSRSNDGEYTHSNLVGRDENLALVESLRPGPRAIPPDPDDPKWELMEPFSGHRLRERKLPHSQLKEHLRGRFHIPPSLLYSVVRPITVSMGANGRLTNWKAAVNGDYEVPVDGDWIVIATIVEKSEILMTKGFGNEAATSSRDTRSLRMPAFSTHDDDPVLFKDQGTGANGKLRLDLEPGVSDTFSEASTKGPKGYKGNAAGDVDQEMERKREEHRLANRPRKFVVLKLVDLGVNSTQGDGSGSAGRGDNYLSLIAYESDQIDTSILLRNTAVRSEVSSVLSAASTSTKKWVYGSRGAFELLYQQAEGTLIAIMNPKVLRPFAAAGKSGAYETKMLRITPRSAEDCLVIGQAADYRRCSAIKANGQRCSSFVDTKARKQTRTTTCDYHLSRHMDELAQGRPEFVANATTRFGGSSGSTGGGTSTNPFPGRKSGGYAGQESVINNINTSFKTPSSNEFSRAALAKKLNSSYGSVGEGMENNSGQVYVSQSPIVAVASQDEEVRASNPSSWKYDISGRYGRGNTEKQTRLKKQIQEEQLMRKIQARFAPPPPRPLKPNDDEGEEGSGGDGGETKKAEEHLLPVLPNGTAEMINAAYSTLEQRKRVAKQKKEASEAKRRKYTGVVAPIRTTDPAGEVESSKLKFMTLTNTKKSSTSQLPITGLNRHTPYPDNAKPSGDSRTKLLSLATNTPTTSMSATIHAGGLPEPNLKLKKSHRPKLRLPSEEVGRTSTLKVVAGELVNLDDFDDAAWEDDLDDLTRPSTEANRKHDSQNVALGDRIMQLHSQPHPTIPAADDDDSDLEII